jgi:hypothetical protein
VAAGFSTDAAVFMHLCVLFALTAATLANRLARLQEKLHHIAVRLARACQDSSSGAANIGAVLVEADTLNKLLHMLFGQTSVGASRTNGSTFVKCLYSTGKLIIGDARLLGMCLNHLRYATIRHSALIHGVSLHRKMKFTLPARRYQANLAVCETTGKLPSHLRRVADISELGVFQPSWRCVGGKVGNLQLG